MGNATIQWLVGFLLVCSLAMPTVGQTPISCEQTALSVREVFKDDGIVERNRDFPVSLTDRGDEGG